MDLRPVRELGCVVSECATNCGRPMRDVLLLCDQCRWELEQALAEMPALIDDLMITLTRQARIVQRNGGRSAEKPLPFHAKASELGDHARSVLVGWVRVLAEDNAAHYPADNIEAISIWLVSRIDDLARHEAAADMWSEITGVANDIRRVTDRPPDRIYAGICGADIEDRPGWQCGEPLYAKPSAELVTCRACVTVHRVDKRRQQMLDALDGMLLTAAEIARLATYLIGDMDRSREQVRKLINQWHSRGLLVPRSRVGDPRFNFGEVKILLAREQARHAERQAS